MARFQVNALMKFNKAKNNLFTGWFVQVFISFLVVGILMYEHDFQTVGFNS